MVDFGDVAANQALSRSVPLLIQDFRVGTFAPTNVTIGTTPTVEALRFDATNETVSAFIHFPPEFDPSVDPIIHLCWSLADAETDGDTLDVTVDYVAITSESTGDGVSKASTQITGQVTVTTANGLAVEDVYIMTITIDRNDATNPLAGTTGIALEFHLTNVTGVVRADLLGGELHYSGSY